MEARRELFWNAHNEPIFYSLTLLFAAILILAIYRYIRKWRKGRELPYGLGWRERVAAFAHRTIVDGLGHSKLFGAAGGSWIRVDRRPKEVYAGLSHFLMAAGFTILFGSSILESASHYLYDFNRGNFYLGYSLATDLGGLMALVGSLMALARRLFKRCDRLDTKIDDLFVLIWLLVMVLSGFLVEGARIADSELAEHPDWAPWSIGGYVVALALSPLGKDSLRTLHGALWWVHIGLGFAAIVYGALFASKFWHFVWGPVNIFFRRLTAEGQLSAIDLENDNCVGVETVWDFSWKQLLDLDACTRCGRCKEACSVYACSAVIDPGQFIQDLKRLERGEGRTGCEDRTISQMVTKEAIWSCTTCRACDEVCPVYVEHVDKIVDVRRRMVMGKADFPTELKRFFVNLEENGNPWAKAALSRGNWAEGLAIPRLGENDGIDTVYWVGCLSAYEERTQRVAVAVSRMLKACGVSFAIMGKAERCCGDGARRLGNEYLFQMLAQHNIDVLAAHKIKKIITHCPHCRHVLKYEYQQLGGRFEVLHHTEVMGTLLTEGKLALLGNGPVKAVYHDPCYLGRYNDIFDTPREVLRGIPRLQLLEKEPCRERAFCCGGGGGRIWMKDSAGSRPSRTLLTQVQAVRPEALITACPFCLTMLDNEVREQGLERSLKVMDVAEAFEFTAPAREAQGADGKVLENARG